MARITLPAPAGLATFCESAPQPFRPTRIAVNFLDYVDHANRAAVQKPAEGFPFRLPFLRQDELLPGAAGQVRPGAAEQNEE